MSRPRHTSSKLDRRPAYKSLQYSSEQVCVEPAFLHDQVWSSYSPRIALLWREDLSEAKFPFLLLMVCLCIPWQPASLQDSPPAPFPNSPPIPRAGLQFSRYLERSQLGSPQPAAPDPQPRPAMPWPLAQEVMPTILRQSEVGWQPRQGDPTALILL